MGARSRRSIAIVRIRVRHTFDFGADRSRIGPTLLRPESWDATRDTASAFGLPASREEWERQAADADLVRRAEEIVRVARGLDARSICSYGVGTARLELNLARAAPGLVLTCGDYAPRTVERLQELFPQAAVQLHDLRTDPPLPGDLHLMHRLDAELDDHEWRAVFVRYPGPILFVPNLLLDLRRALRELGRRVARTGLVEAGWFRNEAALRALWRATHDDRRVSIGGHPAFLLRAR
jgi:hypothetical protein